VKVFYNLVQTVGQALADELDICGLIPLCASLQSRSLRFYVPVKTWELAVESRELNVRRWGKPIDGSENYAGTLAGKWDGSRRMGLSFERIFDGSDQDGVFDDRDHNPTCREIGDYFLAGLIGRILGEGTRFTGKPGNDSHTGKKYGHEDTRGRRGSRATEPERHEG
jgi:hypothetical protein